MAADHVPTETHKAIMVERISKTAREGIDAAVLKDLPRQARLGDTELRIQVRSTALNFPELLMMQNKYQDKPPLPFVLCQEGAGVVIETGSKAQSFKTGDRVMFMWTSGCAREELVLPEAWCVPLPKPFSFSEGASFLFGFETAYHALVHRGRLKSGEWLLVTGAGGGMGAAAVQLGKALGARVIAAASSDDKLEMCRKLGADHTVNYSKEPLKDAVGKITSEAFCDVIFEPVGGDVFNQALRCVAAAGYARLLVVGFASGQIPQIAVNQAILRRFDLVGVQVYGQLLRYEIDKILKMRKELLRLAEEGKLVPYISGEFPMDRYKEAFIMMEERKVLGKCCITFSDRRAERSKL